MADNFFGRFVACPVAILCLLLVNGLPAHADNPLEQSAKQVSDSASRQDIDVIATNLNASYDHTRNTTNKTARICFIVATTGKTRFDRIWNSCGDSKIDSAVKNVVGSVLDQPSRARDTFFLATLEPHSNSLKVEPLPQINWSPFMKEVQKSIKSCWLPPKERRTDHAKVDFDLCRDGKARNLRFERPTGDAVFDGAAMAAIYNATFPVFPDLAPDSVVIDFDFAYNYIDKKSGQKIYSPASNSPPPFSSSSSSSSSPSPSPSSSPSPSQPFIPLLSKDTTSVTPSFDFLKRNAARQINKTEALRLNNEGVRALKQNDYDTAIVKLQGSLEDFPDYKTARENLAAALNNLGLARRNEHDIALKYFQWAVFLNPQGVNGQANVSGLLRRMGLSSHSFEDRKQLGDEARKNNDPIGALVEYQAACAIKDDADLRVACGDICTNFDQDDQALNEYTAAQKIKASPDLDSKIANVRQKMQAASAQRPNSSPEQLWATPDAADALQSTVYDLIHAGKIDEALAFCNKHLQEDPADARFLEGKAICFYQLACYEEALAVADAILKPAPKNLTGARVRMLSLLKLGRLKESDAAFAYYLGLTAGKDKARLLTSP